MLLGRAEGGIKALVFDVRVDLRVGQILLPLQVRRADACPVSAKRAGRDRRPERSRLRGGVILLLLRRRGAQHLLQVGRQKLIDLIGSKSPGVDFLTALHRVPGGGGVVGLGGVVGAGGGAGGVGVAGLSGVGVGVGARDARVLRGGQGCDKRVGVRRVLFEGRAGGLLRLRVDRIVPGQHLGGDGGGVCTFGRLAAHDLLRLRAQSG